MPRPFDKADIVSASSPDGQRVYNAVFIDDDVVEIRRNNASGPVWAGKYPIPADALPLDPGAVPVLNAKLKAKRA